MEYRTSGSLRGFVPWLSTFLLLGCTGELGDPHGSANDDDEPTSAEELGIGPMAMRRLSVYEYDRTVLDLLGDDRSVGASLLPEDNRAPFDNDFETQTPSNVLVVAVETLAGDVATQLVAAPVRRDPLIGCTPTGPNDQACMEAFVRRFGRRAWRRPMTDAEVVDFVAMAVAFSQSQGDFFAGAELVLRAFLQSAEFLYRIELGTPVKGEKGLYRLNGFEIGSRMSYLIWGSTPSEELLDSAESGELDSVEGRRAAASAMLADPRAHTQVERFHSMWLGFEKMPLGPELTGPMRVETAAIIERIVFDEPQSWLQLFQTTETFVDDSLAAHYGLPLPGGTSPAWVDMGSSGRQGILSLGAFLSSASNPNDTSPTKRGKLIRERLLCDPVGAPPPDAPADNPPDTNLGPCKIDQYLANQAVGESCRGCHQPMDAIGFGLENYDMSGQFRSHDDNAPSCTIDGQGELVGAGPFKGPAELSNLLVHQDVDACAAEHLLRYASGRALTGADVVLAEQLGESFRSSDHRFDELIVAIVSSEAFGFRTDMKVEE